MIAHGNPNRLKMLLWTNLITTLWSLVRVATPSIHFEMWSTDTRMYLNPKEGGKWPMKSSPRTSKISTTKTGERSIMSLQDMFPTTWQCSQDWQKVCIFKKRWQKNTLQHFCCSFLFEKMSSTKMWQKVRMLWNSLSGIHHMITWLGHTLNNSGSSQK